MVCAITTHGDRATGARNDLEVPIPSGIKPGELLIDSPDFPAQWRATAKGARDALSLLRSEPALDWTVVSPPPVIHPGSRTGQYRVGADSVLFRKNGPSDISTEDYAVALIDELETPRHVRRRFTVAY